MGDAKGCCWRLEIGRGSDVSRGNGRKSGRGGGSIGSDVSNPRGDAKGCCRRLAGEVTSAGEMGVAIGKVGVV